MARSLDGGESLPVEELYFDSELVDPVVAAGALQKNGVLYFTNPSNDRNSKNCWDFSNTAHFIGMLWGFIID